jgi:glutaminase
MYDAAGDWLYNVGLPAKSGVAGGIIAVLPGQLGIAVYSPPLDEHGNSVRGVRVCEQLSEELRLHVMSPSRRPAPPIRALHSCVESRSRKLRPEPEQQVLREHGARVREVELQGEISFAAGELISNAVLGDVESVEYTVLDFSAVRAVDPVVIPILGDLIGAFEDAGGQVAFSGVGRHPNFIEQITAEQEARGKPPVRQFRDLDTAIEWTEDGLIERYGDFTEPGEMPLSEHGSTLDMDPAQVERLAEVLERREYPAGTRIYSEDEHVDELLLVTRGTVNVLATDAEGDIRRIATLPAGMTLGEVAMLSDGVRIGHSEAATDVVAWALSSSAYRELAASDPALVALFLENMMKMIAFRVAHLRRQLVR